MKIILRLFTATLTVVLVTLLLEYGRAYFAVNSTLGEAIDQKISLCFLLLMLAAVWLYLRCWIGLFSETVKALISLRKQGKAPQQPVEEQQTDSAAAEQLKPAPEKPRDRDPFDYEAAVSTEELDARQQTAASLFAGKSAALSQENEFFSPSAQTAPTNTVRAAAQSAMKEKQTYKSSGQQKRSVHRKNAAPVYSAANKAARSPDEVFLALTSTEGDAEAAEQMQIAVETLDKVKELVAADAAEEQHISQAVAEVFGADGEEEDIFANRDGDVWVRSS